MKHNFSIFFIVIINTFLSCLSSRVNTDPECSTENYSYYNYKDITVLNELRNISNNKEIDSKSFNFYLQNGVNHKETVKKQKISIARNEFFNIPDLKGDITMYILGYYQMTDSIKQYLLLDSDLESNSSLYIINEASDKITSMFLVYSNYDTGFGGGTCTTKVISENVFKISVYYYSDTEDDNGKSSGRCNSMLKLSNAGYLEPFMNINKGI